MMPLFTENRLLGRNNLLNQKVTRNLQNTTGDLDNEVFECSDITGTCKWCDIRRLLLFSDSHLYQAVIINRCYSES